MYVFSIISDGSKSNDGTQVRYVATSTRPVAKIQLNNHKDSTDVKIDGSESSVHKPGGQAALITNGEPKKKTLREMLAGIPGFSMKVSTFLN